MTNQEGATNGDAPTSSTAEPPKNRTASLMSKLQVAVMNFNRAGVLSLLIHEKCPIDRTIFKDAAVVYYNRAVFDALAFHLSKQRRDLLELARIRLPGEALSRLGIIPRQRILNSHAASVAAALVAAKAFDHETARLFVPDIMYTSSGTSLYFLVGCNKDAADILYNSGFMNVDEVDPLEYSPLAALTVPKLTGYVGEYKVDTAERAFFSYLDMCTWLQNKQASLHRVFGLARGTTPLHNVAGEVGKACVALLEEQAEVNPGENDESHGHRLTRNFTVTFWSTISNSPIIRAIMSDTRHRDRFSCPCSTNGSLPLNVLLNEMIINYFLINNIKTPAMIGALVGAFLLSQQPTKCPPGLLDHVPSIVFRACSFASLGLAHSCRSASTNRLAVMSAERRVKHEKLDNLVSECEARFRQSGKPLAIFLTEDWALSMTHYRLRGQSLVML